METTLSTTTLLKQAYELLVTAKSLTELYEENKAVTSKYVHATARGHEAIQIATGLQLLPQDYLSAYYHVVEKQLIRLRMFSSYFLMLSEDFLKILILM